MLYQIIKSIYPNIKDSEFRLEDAGKGAYIQSWTYAQPQPTQAQINAVDPIALAKSLELISVAKTVLTMTDTTLLRCLENGVTVPVEWTNYRKALRAISSGADKTSTALPVRPAYPVGS